ncbi:hypothetical protein [Patulibacter defluvii]|uniref:hypothetical protein n=1 Tax=Patulibacter defluvii TaxID=3095358 RepID=UPI002A76359B|nr:hypothetical protein [Patulibacter sp. DM4]
MPRRQTRSARLVRRWSAALLTVVAVAGLTGCGSGDDEPQGVRVLVTDGRGSRLLLDRDQLPVKDGEHVADVLRRAAKVRLDRQGDVTAIGDTAASGDARWSFWINGAPPETGALDDSRPTHEQRPTTFERATEAEVHDGDTIWFDRSAPGPAARPRGVVGSFPEPFLHGFDGKRWPVRVECTEPRAQACRMVRDVLVRYGIPAATTALRSSYNPETARIAVGRWSAIREDPAAGLLEMGVGISGIFARPDRDGRRIALLDAEGRTARTLGAGAGLIVASRYRDEPPSWAVTGTDDAGVLRAAGALDPTLLARRFAVAIEGGDVLPLPLRR